MSQILDWKPAGGVAAVVTRDGRRLMLLATANPVDSVWTLVALESAESADSVEQVFEQHAHASVAENVSLDKALEVAQVYADAWLAGDAEALERCKCKEILPETTLEAETISDDIFLRRADPENPLLKRLADMVIEKGDSLRPTLEEVLQHQDKSDEHPVDQRRNAELTRELEKEMEQHDTRCNMGPNCTCSELESLSPFHQHLEVCEQCREHPFALCAKGAVTLRAEVG